MTTYVQKSGALAARTSGVATEAITNTSTYLGSEIDNATNKDRYLTIEAVWSYASAPTAAKTLRLFIEYAVDGTNYETASPTQGQIANWSPPASTSAQRLVIVRSRLILPSKFKIRCTNVDTGQTVTMTLNAYTHNDEAVSS
jgi:hypothetical protein